jgi:hypothetical protein
MKRLILTTGLLFSTMAFGRVSNTLVNLDRELQKKLDNHIIEMREYVVRGHSNPKLYFIPFERENILKSSMKFLKALDSLERFDPDKSHGLRSKKRAQRNYTRLMAKTIKYKYLAKYLNFTFIGKNPYVAVLSESDSKLGHDSKAYRKMIRKTLRQSWEVLDRNTGNRDHDRDKDLDDNSFFHLADLAVNQTQFRKFEAKYDQLSNEQTEIVLNNTSEYMEHVLGLKEAIKDIDWKVGAYSPLYHLKVVLLKAASFIALPGKHKISLETLKKVDRELEPGDIGLIQRYNKLSNLVFKGNWTHSLIYLGEYSKMAAYFNSDAETQETFKQKCKEQKLQCESFMSYLMAKHPDAMRKYIKSDGSKDPIATIESLKPGVILFTMKKSMGWDNLVLLRPKLTKRDKALSIATAFENLGKPYDYNFNGQTNERFVCTELVSYSYSADPKINKKGLTWEMNYVMNKPVMYAFDVLETYFKRQNTAEQELDLVLYIKGEKGEFGKSKRGSVEELLESVDLTD